MWLRVRVAGSGASCHRGYRSCLYRRVPLGGQALQDLALEFTETQEAFDPVAVYGDVLGPTIL